MNIICESVAKLWKTRLKLSGTLSHYTSQECSTCGYTSPLNRQTQEKFLCLKCKLELNADENAALNILTRGRRGRVCGDVEVARIYEAETSMAL